MLRKGKATPAQLGEIVVVDSAVFNAHRESRKSGQLELEDRWWEDYVLAFCRHLAIRPLCSLSVIPSTIIFALSFR